MKKYKEVFFSIVTKFLRDLYMDDSVTGAQTKEDAFDLYQKCKTMMQAGGFLLRKWDSNDDELRNMIFESELKLGDEIAPSKISVKKILGIKWDPAGDKLIFGVEGVIERALQFTGPITKRFMLKTTASHYDPIGILTPITIRFKCLMQEACELKFSWDDEVHDNLATKWKKLLNDCTKLKPFVIERNYLVHRNLCDVIDMQLHGFSDASGKAYACVIYLRVLFTNGDILTSFIASKTRVAPMKKVSIPRLELMACLILSRLMKVVIESVTDYVIHGVYFWTDNTDCIHWINNRSKVWSRFVQNRVTEIRDNIPEVSFTFCPGEENPADIPSRGLDITHPERHEKWLHGPNFLQAMSEFWPKTPDNVVIFSRDAADDVNVTTNVCVNSLAVKKPNNIDEIIDIHSFHSFRKLIMVTCYVERFIDNCKRAIKSDRLQIGEITNDERMRAKQKWLLNEQAQIKVNQMNQLKIGLGAYYDKDGIIKLRGRLEHSDLSLNCKFPVLIPKSSYLGDLIILDAHTDVLHYGMKDTLTQVRSEYWLVQGRSRVKTVLYKCVLCRKFEGKLMKKLPMAPLPDYRVQCCDPFTHVGVDYLGPLHVYPSPRNRNSSLEKVHVVLFTCANSRAVHLDVVPDTSCSAFISCLKRLFGRRGFPKLFISDNAKCFVGAELKRFLKIKEIEWKFILEVSPWWGGFYERLIQTVKRSLRKTLRRNSASFDELRTIIIEIESVINCRPLCYLYSDEVDEGLTPSHLMMGRRLLSSRKTSPTDIYEETKNSLNNRVKYLNSLISHYEKRWKKEYLTELWEYQKNNRLPAKRIKIGDIVLIEEEGLPRSRWRMGKVYELITSKDGHVRGCKLRVHNENRKVSYLNRPVNKLCFFEVSSADAN